MQEQNEKKKEERKEKKKLNIIRNKTACLLIYFFIMISFRTAYEATEIHIFIMKAVIEEQTAAEQQIAINNQLTAFRENALLKTRIS